MAKKRTLVQALWTFATNPHVQNFWRGKIYTGRLKSVCVPGLNCYSCPGAAGACPIGAMQAVEGSTKYGFSMFGLGFLVFVGLLLGRFVCGWLCPFGWVQELLHKLPTKKCKVPQKPDRLLRKLKYGILAVMVIGLPILTAGRFGVSTPYFCKYLCPAGTLEGGIPLMLANPALRTAIGGLFCWKAAVLAAVIIGSMLVFRPFCKYLCPLGAFYALFAPVSLYRYQVDESKCVHCGRCAQACKMDVDVVQNPNHAECIRCGACMNACPRDAIHVQWRRKKEAAER